jgi:hypothetical protein
MLVKLYVNGLFWQEFEFKPEMIHEGAKLCFFNTPPAREIRMGWGDDCEDIGCKIHKTEFVVTELFARRCGHFGWIAECDDSKVYVDIKTGKLAVRGKDGRK